MIRRLRVHFILIIMTVVTALLLVILGIVLTMTARSVERETVSRMRDLAMEPEDAPEPGEPAEGVRLAYFVLRVNRRGVIVEADGRDFDLTDKEKIRGILTSAETDGKESGKLPQYHLRYVHLQLPFAEHAAAAPGESGTVAGQSEAEGAASLPQAAEEAGGSRAGAPQQTEESGTAASRTEDGGNGVSEPEDSGTAAPRTAKNGGMTAASPEPGLTFDASGKTAVRPASDGAFLDCYVFADMSGENSMMHHLLKNCLVMAGGGFILFLLFSVVLARWFVKPVEKTLEEQKAFIADASHELKTPLTVMMTNTEMLKDPSFSEADRRVFVDRLCTVTKQMRSLVEELLDLARIDRNLPRTLTDVDFSALTENELLLFEAPFFEAGLEVVSHVEAGLRVKGDETRLREAVGVLLDNARKYAAAHSVVSVQLTGAGGCASLSVASEGKLLTKEEQKKIFQRFYRADTSRARNGSYGLGLPIAAAIVEQHRGAIGVSTADGRNVFTIRIPLRRRHLTRG